MTDWTAVVIGFLVELVLATVGLAVPVLGQLTAAVIGGFVAGYVAGGGLGNGAWHGLLAGALGGVVLAVLIGVFGSVVLGVLTGGPGAIVGFTATTFAVVVIFLLSLPSALAGAVGGAV